MVVILIIIEGLVLHQGVELHQEVDADRQVWITIPGGKLQE